jgi:conjugative relaxase-like TrwC/TraI family protein
VPVSVAGYDLTFSAPKSVSVLFALGEADVRDAVRAAHDRAVREALGYAERTAAAVRRGAGGSRVEPAGGFIAATFRHRTSRAGDPQLHTHVLVANLAQGPDGRWSTLDGRRLYAHARATSFVYQAVLRSELTRELGVRWLSVRDGIAEIAGVPMPVLKEFSRRRADIEAALERSGTSGPRASEAAALATRQAKDRRTSFPALQRDWRERAAARGFARDELQAILQSRVAREMSDAQLDHLFALLAGPTGLTLRAATFSRRDVVQALSERLPAEIVLSGARLEALAERFLSSERVVALLPGDADTESQLAFRRRDGRAVPLAREEWLYSTPELLALERRIVETAGAARNAGAGQADAAAIQHAVRARPTLGGDQRAMIERLCADGDRISVVVGKAGTGKTFALAAAREAWQATGHPVLGVAIARRAAKQLQADAGIATTSVAALLRDLDRPNGGLPRGAVLVVDEAGMVATRQLATLLTAVQRVDGKLVLVGDHRQLPELEAGGSFRALVRRGVAIELTENRRQSEAWERRALDLLRDGGAGHAVQQYVEHERVHVAATPEAAREQLVGDWHATARELDAVMIARRRADVADLNRRARARLRDAGAVVGVEIQVGEVAFARGDQVVVKRNDARLGVTNGERGVVIAVDDEHQRLAVQLSDDVVTLDHAFLTTPTRQGDPSLTHGYAITCHVAQGVTVDRAFVLADDSLTSELGYTAMSRGRHRNDLYVADRPDEPRAEYAPVQAEHRTALDRLVAALQDERAAVLAIDSGRPDPEQKLAQAQRQLTIASATRAELDEGRWRPWRRRELQLAVEREAAARRTVEDLARVVAEQRHAGRPGFDERIERRRRAEQRDGIIEREIKRSVSRGVER